MENIGKRMSEVAKELYIPYNKLAYWVKYNYVPCLKISEKSRPRFLPEHIEKIKEYIEYDKNNSKEDKAKKTNLEKFGVENPFQSEEIKQKIKEKMIKKYGVSHALQNKEIREKCRQTNLNKYGEDNPLKNKDIREKIKQTNLEKFGVDNPQKNKEIREKTQRSFDETIEKDKDGNYKNINLLRGEEFWGKMQSEPLKNICNYFGVNYQSITSLLLLDEFKDKYYSTYTFPKTQVQKSIKDILEDFGLKVEFNDRSVISPLELDIFIPAKNFAIEYNGNLWHSEYFLGDKEAFNKHREKTLRCREKGIRLFHIFEHQWENRKDQILNFIKSILGLNTEKIMARKCEINNICSEEFLEKNHIQGYGKRTIKYFNLIYNGEIVASMTVSRHHRQNIEGNPVVLNRLCFKDSVSIQGGSGKLFSEFKKWAKIEGYDKILSWSDNCWTDGRIYEILGFTLKKEYGPDYFYYDVKNHRVVSKQSQKKSNTGCLKEETERNFCRQKGLWRVYDSGKKLWGFNLNNE